MAERIVELLQYMGADPPPHLVVAQWQREWWSYFCRNCTWELTYLVPPHLIVVAAVVQRERELWNY